MKNDNLFYAVIGGIISIIMLGILTVMILNYKEDIRINNHIISSTWVKQNTHSLLKSIGMLPLPVNTSRPVELKE